MNIHIFGISIISEKLPTYPSPKPTFFPKWELSIVKQKNISFAREMWQPCRRGAKGKSVVEFKSQRRSCKLYIFPFPAQRPKRPGELARRLVSVLYIDRRWTQPATEVLLNILYKKHEEIKQLGQRNKKIQRQEGKK